MKHSRPLLSFCTVLLFCVARLRAAEDIVIADFEGTNYGAWKTTGTAFGSGPARGALPGQMAVEGYSGRGLVNSFSGGDKSTGTLTSPAFKLERRYLSFLIGAGGYSNKTCMNLFVDGKTVRTATGPNVQSGGSERLQSGGWDVAEFLGREAVLQIVDQRTGGWGHINVDQIVQTDRAPAVERRNVTRELAITQRYLHFPVKNGVAKKNVEVRREGKANVYLPAKSRAQCIRAEGDSFLRRIFRGSCGPMLLHFVERAELSPAEIRELERALKQKKTKP